MDRHNTSHGRSYVDMSSSDEDDDDVYSSGESTETFEDEEDQQQPHHPHLQHHHMTRHCNQLHVNEYAKYSSTAQDNLFNKLLKREVSIECNLTKIWLFGIKKRVQGFGKYLTKLRHAIRKYAKNQSKFCKIFG